MFAVIDHEGNLYRQKTLPEALIWTFRHDHNSVILYRGIAVLATKNDKVDFRPLHSGWIAAKHLAEKRMKFIDQTLPLT